ncbi:hypothetical protein HWV62_6207 [Athelia sp. TMB]|nr:hypothetical protein HWV62_6207 [Athelia sp. TMB]
MHWFDMAPYCPAAVEAERLAFEEFWAEKDAQAAAKGKPPPVRPTPETKLHKLAICIADIDANMAPNSNDSILKIKQEHETLVIGEWNPHTRKKSFPDSRTPPTPAFFSRAIDKWKALISPHTPAHGAGFNCSPSDPVAVYVQTLLRVFGLRLTGSRQQVETAASAILDIWPSIWTWLRTIHVQTQVSKWLLYNETEVENCSVAYELLVSILFVLVYSNPPTPLSILVGDMKGVKKMMANIWIEQGRDTSTLLGFKAASYTGTWANYPAPGPILPQIIDQCQGGVETVKILFCRLKNNLAQVAVEPDWPCFKMDMRLVIAQLSDKTPAAAALLRKSLISHDIPFVETMVDALILLLCDGKPQQREEVSEFLQFPLIGIARHLTMTGREYHCASQLNHGTIIALLAKGSITREPNQDEELATLSNQLLKIIGRFSIYKTFFRALQKNISPTRHMISLKPQESRDSEVFWLVDRVDQWAKIRGTERYLALDCCNTQVRGLNSAPVRGPHLCCSAPSGIMDIVFAFAPGAGWPDTAAKLARKGTGLTSTV